MEKNKKKRYGILAAVVCLALAAGLGTYAWLTAEASKTNTFTVGSITTPDKKPDTTDPTKPGDQANVDGNLTETNWTDNSKIVPGGTIGKNPNVGIGKGSDDAYVFVYVKNDMVKSDTEAGNTPYFTLGTNWAPVAASNNEAWAAKTTGTDGQYISGLFVYKKDQEDSTPAKLTAGSTGAYTGEVFSSVVVPGTLTGDMVVKDGKNPTMTVSAYIFGADQKDDADQTDVVTALKQAKTWAAKQASGQN